MEEDFRTRAGTTELAIDDLENNEIRERSFATLKVHIKSLISRWRKDMEEPTDFKDIELKFYIPYIHKDIGKNAVYVGGYYREGERWYHVWILVPRDKRSQSEITIKPSPKPPTTICLEYETEQHSTH